MTKKHDEVCEMKDGYLSCDCPRGVRTSQHTPGPWKIETDEDRDGAIVMDSENRIVANCQGCDIPGAYGEVSTDEAKANAHLIAAAPELLEAAKRIIQYNEVHENGFARVISKHSFETLQVAVAKAEGR